MWFLIRTAFWFSMVLVMLPIFDDEATTRLKDEKGVELTDALGAAAGAISYVGSLCSEKPDVCVKGAETFTALGSRARKGARVAYGYLDTQFADETQTKAADTVLTGTITSNDAALTDTISRIPIPLPRPKNI
ncbi:MAG: hypothetical protein JWM58_4080 [Rhizobium sp.]|nr:hypothetical protein [Rhizobium sp.]